MGEELNDGGDAAGQQGGIWAVLCLLAFESFEL